MEPKPLTDPAPTHFYLLFGTNCKDHKIPSRSLTFSPLTALQSAASNAGLAPLLGTAQ